MTEKDIIELLDRYSQPRENDIVGLTLVSEIMKRLKKTCDVIAAAEHDIIYLAIDIDDLIAAGVTVEEVETLERSGVHYDSSAGSLAMFV